MKKNTFVEGTVIASAAIIFTKFLGTLYVIPFYSIIGEQGGSLYSYAYNIYNLFLNISTAGIPIAISKIISEYNALKLYEAKERAYKIGRNIILFISLIAFFLLFAFAEEFAYLIIGDIKGGNTIEDIGFVIRSVSLCLLIIPYLSVAKGYLQGHKFITPSSMSQVIEQCVRIFVILIGSYLAINIFKTETRVGVAVALFGAFLGGLVAYIYVNRKIKKNRSLFIRKDKDVTDKIKSREIVKKILSYAIPLIIISVIYNIYSITDQALIIRGLDYLGYEAKETELISSIIATWGVKICMILHAIATGLSMSLIPNIISSFVKKEYELVNKKFNQAIGVILVVTLPMTLGISVLSGPVYTVFYGYNLYGSIILRYLIFISFLSSISIVMNIGLQSMNKYKIVYTSNIVGLITNVILNIPLILLFDYFGIYPYYGSLTSTVIGYIISFSITLKSLKKEMNFNYSDLIKIINKMCLPTICMMAPLLILNIFMPTYTSRFIQIPIILLYALIGGTIYIYMTYKNRLLQETLGDYYINKIVSKIQGIKKIFKNRKK